MFALFLFIILSTISAGRGQATLRTIAEIETVEARDQPQYFRIENAIITRTRRCNAYEACNAIRYGNVHCNKKLEETSIHDFIRICPKCDNFFIRGENIPMGLVCVFEIRDTSRPGGVEVTAFSNVADKILGMNAMVFNALDDQEKRQLRDDVKQYCYIFLATLRLEQGRRKLFVRAMRRVPLSQSNLCPVESTAKFYQQKNQTKTGKLKQPKITKYLDRWGPYENNKAAGKMEKGSTSGTKNASKFPYAANQTKLGVNGAKENMQIEGINKNAIIAFNPAIGKGQEGNQNGRRQVWWNIKQEENANILDENRNVQQQQPGNNPIEPEETNDEEGAALLEEQEEAKMVDLFQRLDFQ